MRIMTIRSVMAATMLMLSTAAWSSSVTIPNTFTAGTPAVAADVNANFDAVKTGVNDNDARITTNDSRITTVETNKQNRVTGTCGAGSSIRTINSDGSVVCEVDDNSGGTITGVIAGGGLTGGGTAGAVTLKLSSGTISVSPAELNSNYPGCYAERTGFAFNWSTTSTYSNCYGVTGVHLPNGATVTGLTCYLYDNDTSGAYNYVQLGRRYNTATGTVSIAATPVTVDSTAVQALTATSVNASYALIDNSQFDYFLVWYSAMHNTTTVGTNAKFHGCRITYTY